MNNKKPDSSKKNKNKLINIKTKKCPKIPS